MTDFAEVIQGLSGDDPRGNIAAIKAAVKDQLHETDDRVRVDLTDHFNHHYVPDIVISWPGTSERRNVFLRTSYREDDLARDIAVLGTERPILMSLAKLPEEEPPGALIAEQALASNSLIADPYGLEVLEEEAEIQPVVSLLSHAVLQGGRGVMSVTAARHTGTSLSTGFAGAQEGDATSTSAAVDAAAGLLDSQRASQINRLLHAVWLGSGRPASTFPGAAGITAVLDANSLRFMLELPDINDDEFWTRIGSGLTAGRICELQDYSASVNLQRLLRRNARRLTAKACRVTSREQRIETPEWLVANSNLVLRFANESLFSRHRVSTNFPPPLVMPVPSRWSSFRSVPVAPTSGSAKYAYPTAATSSLTAPRMRQTSPR